MDYTIPANAYDACGTWYGNRKTLDDAARASDGEMIVVERNGRFRLAVFDKDDGFLGFV